MNIRFITVLFFAVVVVVLASFLWPKLTYRSRPQPLTAIRSMVAGTVLGSQIETVLGVTEEDTIEPVDLSVEVSRIGEEAKMTLSKTIEGAIYSRIGTQFIRQYQNFPPEQQSIIQEAICVQQSVQEASSEAEPELNLLDE